MAYWRVMASSVTFDTVARRDTAIAQIVTAGGSATPGTDAEGRPTLNADINVALNRTKAEAIRQKLRDAVAAGWIVAGEFTVHRCRHDEPGVQLDCRTLQYEVG